ncbi:MAG: polymer-forming cytoskeletal protein [Acidobacteria bacterium]|jgi:cytoskeletal protein CcmA (bactofilin family)|nr:polymer-forming cytoskeletal protein [Acidobacteriota bacterium]
MFKKNEAVTTTINPINALTPPIANERTSSFIGKTLFIKGEVLSEDEVLIEGKIEGKINVKSKVIVGKDGVVNAEIEAKEVVIKGVVNGNVKGSYKVEIIPNGTLNGNIISQRVVLADGANFKGSIDMTPKDDGQET